MRRVALAFVVAMSVGGGSCVRVRAQYAPAATAAAQSAATAEAAKVDAAVARFFAAAAPQDAAKRIGDIERSGVSFEEALRRLRDGRAYRAEKPGVVQARNRTADGVEHIYSVEVPKDYDPARRWQVRIQLHGGVMRRTTTEPEGDGSIGPLSGDAAGADQFYVLPTAWDAAPWWSDDQVLNLEAIVDALKRSYTIDENRVARSGVSDGGTGTYYIAMRDTTPFASFLPLNGFIGVLVNERLDDGRIFINNLRDKPLFIANGGRDMYYPLKITEPVTQHLVAGGVEISDHPQEYGQHNTRWWPMVVNDYEKFVADHPRDPDPDRLTWQTAGKANNRADWLVIDELGAAPGEARELPDVNTVGRGEATLYEMTDNGKIFPRWKAWGRVDLSRAGNTVTATTKGVRSFTLLLSPEKFDFGQPIRVVANGREVFNARVERSLATLLEWAARDNDRTMLYAAAIRVNLVR